MKTYKFLKITDNDDYRNFYIDYTAMSDYRIRVSILWSRFLKYLDGTGQYHPVYKVLNTDWSVCCVCKCSCDSLNDARQQQEALVKFYEGKLRDYKPKEFSDKISFS